MRTRTLFVILLALLAGSFTSLLADGKCDEFRDITKANSSTTRCLSEATLSWMAAGQNDSSNPASNIWGGRLLFTQYDDGTAWVQTECGASTFDKDGEQLAYSVYSRDSQTTNVTTGFGSLFGFGSAQFEWSSPAGAGLIGGPVMVQCTSSDPAVLRSKIAAIFSRVLYSPQGMKLAEVTEPLKFVSSHRWAFQLLEGGAGLNWENTGIAITNITRRQTAPNGVTVRISFKDEKWNHGPYRDITLNPPKLEVPEQLPTLLPGETKVFMLWSLFGDKPVEGNKLFSHAYPAQEVYGTVTVEAMEPNAKVVVSTTRMFGETGLTAVPVSPVPAP